MGYHTDFYGSFDVTPVLSPVHRAYLLKFSQTRRMARDAKLCEAMPDPVRIAAGLPVGDQGENFVGATGLAGQDHDLSITNYNTPPNRQPGLWCQWTPNESGDSILWDDGEKFYNYTEWLVYLIDHFLKPWGYTLNGSCAWQGGEDDDRGNIYVKDNRVQAIADEITSPAPVWD